jgi:hypothetical protein
MMLETSCRVKHQDHPVHQYLVTIVTAVHVVPTAEAGTAEAVVPDSISVTTEGALCLRLYISSIKLSLS